MVFCERDITEQVVANYMPYARSDSEFRPREFSGLHIALRVRCSKRPVSAVSSITIEEKGQTLALTFGDADLRQALGIIYCPTSTGKLGEHVLVEIQYTAGFGCPPDNAKMAVALLVQEWLLAESLTAGGSAGWVLRFRSGDYSETRMLWSTEETKVGLGTQLSKRAQLLLRPWLRKIRLG